MPSITLYMYGGVALLSLIFKKCHTIYSMCYGVHLTSFPPLDQTHVQP